MAVDGQPSSFPPKPPDSRMSYASAASGSISFNLKKPLIPLSSYRGEPAIVVPEDVIKESLVDFNFALVGKFPIYPKIIRPNMERIRLFFARLNLKAAYSIGSLDLGHILIRLNSAEDYQRIWARETWDIGKVQMKIFKWSMDFASHKESSIIPAWILLPGLPPNFFQQHILFSIVQVVGNPLKMDQATATLSRPSIARICVELDLLTPNPSRIWISSGNKDKGFWQKIDYEYLPLYCCDCFRLGHSQAACPGSMMPSPNLQHNYRESPQHRQPLRGQESNSKDVSNNIVKFSSHGLQVSRSAINASDADVSTAPTNVAPQSVYVPQIWVPRVKKMMSHNQNNENAGNSSIVVSNAFASLQELEEESAPANIDHLISGNLLQHGTNASAVDLQQDNSADLEQGAESTNIISPHSQQGVDLQQSDNQLTQPILHRSCCLDQSPFQQSSEIVAENLMPVHTHHLSLVDLNTNTEMSGEKTNKQVKLGRINTYTSEEKTNTEMSGGTLNNVSLCTQNANTHVQACPNLQGILKLINSSAADPIPEDGDVEDVEDNSEEIAINREKNTKDNSAGVEEMSINAEKYTEDSPVHVNGKEIIPWTGINCDEIDLTHNSSGLNARARGFLIPKTRSTFKIGRKPVIDKIRAAEEQGKTVFSFEFFPPKTEDGVDNLFERIDRMVSYGPSFCDITWGAGGSTADITLDIANKMQNMICVETMMHLTCTNMPVEKIDDALKNIKGNGIQNVLALRGDPPHGQDKFVQIEDGFACALDLVKHIRSTYGAYFGITVAGYPEAHPDVIQSDGLATPEGYQSDLEYLKRKVDAGADLIVTQLFYDTDIFLKFVNDCRQIGINCPIVPGIMPINSYKGFLRMTGFCKTKIPAEIMAALEPIQENEEAVKAYGIHLGTEMCKKILAHGIQTLHLYTLNVDKSAVSILMNLGLIEEGKISRSLPWRPPTNVFRTKENVRPIFWANRPKSYISRTMEWEDYPHGHWGVSRNPSYGALTDQQFLRSRARDKKLNEEWGIPVKSVEDIQEQFTKFWLGELKSSPWSEVDGLQPEIKIISEQLGKINQKGFLTINSQPAVNGESSDSQTVGWGGPGGFVYQKAYVEFFCSKEKLTALVDKCKDVPSLTYMAVNKEGVLMSNLGNPNVNAVTWGAFPGKEIVQSLVVDAASFLIWKEEAFEIWSRGWARLYPEDDPSRELLNEVQGSYFLVSLVDNDYIKGDLFAVFKEL